MRKMLAIAFTLLMLLCGCAAPKSQPSKENRPPEYRVGMWLSYIELDGFLKGDFKASFGKMLGQCKDLGITDLFVHVRPFCDAVYPSALFPLRNSVKSYNYDVLAYMVEQTHQSGMYFHAWINPYRVCSKSTDVTALPKESPAVKWQKDTQNVCFADGIYLNPASAEVRRLVLDGVRELLTNYDVDGIHFDDYFYPTADPSFDREAYADYCKSCDDPLPLDDWRRTHVNALISAVYTAVKFQDKALVFSVSPAASVEKNRTGYYADVAAWMESGTVDWIIPQLYFGFNYPQEDFCFDNLLNEWQALPRAESVRLMVGLAAYKINIKNMPDTEEWYMNETLLADEASLCRQTPAVSGHIYYSYTDLFSTAPTNTRARERLMEEENAKND
ncbi:MAG: family 10 glycosylhydrolase [Clostridia bacterium]|nr:family 10 glycosylhydrolase [Clostridia bacterium]